MDARKRRQMYLKRREALKTERSSWDTHCRELSEFLQPWRSRFFAGAVNAGFKRHANIVNNTAGKAARVMASGIMAGVTSPARPWARYTLADYELASYGSVKEWLEQVSQIILAGFASSNLYNVLHGRYLDLGVFGTGPMLLEKQPGRSLHATPLPWGEYSLAIGEDDQVDTLYRDRVFTVKQLVQRFRLDACSLRVRGMFNQGQLDAHVEVVHVVEPRRDRDPNKAGPRNMPFSSCWFEKADDDQLGFLLESGYEELPLMAPRWDVLPGDAYGHSPGMAALGDAKALQLYEKQKALLVERMSNPAMVGPASLEGKDASITPGAITYLEAMGPQDRFQPAVEVNPAAIQAVELSIREHERRISSEFFADLWLMLSQSSDSPQQTAREVAEKHEEKLLQLGPVMERLEAELLNPLMARAFALFHREGLLPPPPREAQGQELRVEYSSMMAQAQKMVEGTAVERLVGFVANLATIKPDAPDKLDGDEAVEAYANALGASPRLVVPDDQVAATRQQRAQQRAAQAAQEQALAQAQTGKTLSETDMGGDNALTRLFGGVAAAQAGGVQ